jgi:hypothetical protein
MRTSRYIMRDAASHNLDVKMPVQHCAVELAAEHECGEATIWRARNLEATLQRAP